MKAIFISLFAFTISTALSAKDKLSNSYDTCIEIESDSCKWLKTNASWCYSKWNVSSYEDQDLAQIEIIGDTLVGDRLCSVLGLYIEGVFVEESRLICFYEEENEQVYFYEDEEFKPLYNFSLDLLPGDTVEFYLPKQFKYYDISGSSGFISPTNEVYKYLILSNEWVTLDNGEVHRISMTQNLLKAEYKGNCFYMGRIINGVGSVTGFLGNFCLQPTAGQPAFFRNFESTDLNYSEADGCIVTSVNSIEQYNINVFPNPTSNLLRLESPDNEILSVALYSSLGQKVKAQVVRNTEVDISVQHLAEGIYLLDVELQNGFRFTEKVIVLDK